MEFTECVLAMGWKPPENRSAFDVLPLVIQMPLQAPKIYSLPEDSVMEVRISHPDFAWFEDLGLKWHAVPVISDMVLEGERLRFAATLFSRFYMGTEIASRNFGDESRYNHAGGGRKNGP